MNQQEKELINAIQNGKINTIKELLSQGVRVINTMSISSLVMKKDNPSLLKFMHEHGVDLIDRGGLFLFQSLCSNKLKNAQYLLTLTPQDHTSIEISIINYHCVAKRNKFEVDKAMLQQLFSKITNIDSMLSKIRDKEERLQIERLLISKTIQARDNTKPHKI